jgi:hypothetical protein
MKKYLLKNFKVSGEIKSTYYEIYEKHFVVLVGEGVDPQYIINEESIVASTAEDATPVQRAKATLLNEIKDAVAYKFISANEIPDGCYPKNCRWSGNLADDVEIDNDLELQKAKDIKIAKIKQACRNYLQKYITKDEDNAIKLEGVSHYFKLLESDIFALSAWLAKNKPKDSKGLFADLADLEAKIPLPEISDWAKLKDTGTLAFTSYNEESGNFEWYDSELSEYPYPPRSWSGTFIKDESGEYIKQDRKQFPYLEIQRILSHYVVRDENAFTLRDAKIDEVNALTTIEEIEAYDVNSIYE